MNDFAEFSIRGAEKGDLPALLALQHRAFGRVARQLGLEPSVLEPVRETLADVEELFSDGVRFYVAVASGGEVVGGVRVAVTDRVGLVGRLVVDEPWLRRGVATRLMDAVETSSPRVEAYELFTGADAVAPLTLYLHRGYSIVRRDDSGPVPLVWLRKRGDVERGEGADDLPTA